MYPPLVKSQAKKDDVETLELDGYQVQVTHPDKPYFTQEAQLSKLDLVRYYLAVAPGALRGMADRPLVLKRFVGGAHAEPFYQKRAPLRAPVLAPHRHAQFSFRPYRRRSRDREHRRPHLDRQYGLL